MLTFPIYFQTRLHYWLRSFVSVYEKNSRMTEPVYWCNYGNTMADTTRCQWLCVHLFTWYICWPENKLCDKEFVNMPTYRICVHDVGLENLYVTTQHVSMQSMNLHYTEESMQVWTLDRFSLGWTWCWGFWYMYACFMDVVPGHSW